MRVSKAACPRCGWKFPFWAGKYRRDKRTFNCPDCGTELRYEARIGPLGKLKAPMGVVAYLVLRPYVKLGGWGILALVLFGILAIVFFLRRERLMIHDEASV